MSAERPDSPLPSADVVRCGLCLDTPLLLRWAIEELDLDGAFDEISLAANLERERDRDLLDRLRELLPMEDLAGASRDRRIDIEAICRQHPFVYAMWVMTGAGSYAGLKKALEISVKQRQAD